MKKILTLIVTFLMLLSSSLLFAASNPMSPVGYWRTIDDVTGKQKGIVQIWETADHTLYGRILKIFPSPGHDQNEVCRECTGERHNKRIVGMVFLENLKQDSDHPNVWTGGTILDPNNGKIYRATVQVNDNGTALNVRGYLGISLFGRTQTWFRTGGVR